MVCWLPAVHKVSESARRGRRVGIDRTMDDLGMILNLLTFLAISERVETAGDIDLP
jgi:hypothetical protein